MQLDKINKVNDIKKLNYKEKEELSAEIRDFILGVVSKNGGHLASNLGTVELTIALESVFDVSKDKIIWDVGHQCYTHKILTGRKQQMKNLRQFHGISGFPKTKESKTDVFNTGHSSTSISAAMGIATARDLQKKDYNVIAVIGDGALTGGMALEALNHVGCAQTRLIIILNDNEMSISKNISGMNKLLTKLRSKKNYRKTNDRGKKIVSSIPAVGKVITQVVSKSKNAIKQVFVPGMYFEEIGIKYLGPVDGHNIEELENLFNHAKDFDVPVLIHVLTKKGKGYSFAEENPSKFHGIGSFDLSSGENLVRKSKDYSKVFGDKLVKLASKNKKIVAITAAMKDGTGLTDFAKRFPSRFFDVGIAEQHALTFAAGLASTGLIPFVSIYSSFYQRGYDQVIHDICLQNLPVIMCVDRAGIVGNDGETHQGMFDLAFFKLIPNIVIMAPGNFQELESMMELAISLKKPVVIRYPRGGEGALSFSVKKIIFGKSDIVMSGNDISIFAIGKTVSKALTVANELKKDHINCEVINCRFLKPFDQKCAIQSISKTHNVIVMEDGTVVGGLSSSIKELLVDYSLNVSFFKYYAYPDKFIEHGSSLELEKKYAQDVTHILQDIRKSFQK